MLTKYRFQGVQLSEGASADVVALQNAVIEYMDKLSAPGMLDITKATAELTRLTASLAPWLTANRIINGNFAINQEGYVSGAALAAGSYGHDGWKAGASGGDYTFTQSADGCTITIAVNKSLIQVIEDKRVKSSDAYCVSWTGTAQARYAVNSATPAGSYANSPVVLTGQNRGTTMSFEFNSGTLTDVVVIPGIRPGPFFSDPDIEMLRCERYHRLTGHGCAGGWAGATSCSIGMIFDPPMRAAPTMSLTTTTPVVLEPGIAVRTAAAATIANANTGPSVNGWVCLVSGFTGATAGHGAVMDGNFIKAVARL